MKTSFDLSESLLQQVKQLAKQRGTTTRSLVEEALMKLLAEAETVPGFTLRDIRFGSGGMAAEFVHGGWERLRDEIYPLPEPVQSQSQPR